MDAGIRTLVYLAAGLALLAANLWFARSVYDALFPSEYVIAPFRVVTDEKTHPDYGATLAEMLASRIASVLKDLAAEPHAAPGGNGRKSSTDVTTLFLPQGVEIPTGLLQTININVSVGGVQVGGLVNWLHDRLPTRKPLTFSLVRKGDGVVVSADLGDFVAQGEPFLWLSSGKDSDEIVTDIAYALIQKKIAEKHSVQVSMLEPKEFRIFMETLVSVERLNDKVRARYVVDGDFANLLPKLESLERKAPQWHELTYLAASVAESAGNLAAATARYDRLASAWLAEPKSFNPVVAAWIQQRQKDYGASGTAGLSVSEQRFIAATSAFAKLMSLRGADPKVTFKRLEEGVLSFWDSRSRSTIVSTPHLGSPGLPQYVALMGRFMERNYERCFGGGRSVSGDATSFWNDFRYSIVAYLINSVPQFSDPGVLAIAKDKPLFKGLKALEVHGVVAVQRLSLELLERFECDWSAENLSKHIEQINQQRGLLPLDAVSAAFPTGTSVAAPRRRATRRVKDARKQHGDA